MISVILILVVAVYQQILSSTEQCFIGLLRVRGGFALTEPPKMLRNKHGGSRVKSSLWPFCGRIPGPTKTVWASFDL